jgi:branched-chain amino acid transport system substrate-binding protein
MKILHCKKLSFCLVSLMALVVVLWGIGPLSAVAKDSVKLGLLSPFSPPGDPAAGKRMRWGAELAIEYINNEMGGVLGGRQVELVVEDDSGTPADGIAGFRKLVQKDGVVAVVGQYHSSVCLAVNKVSRDLQVPLFSSGASSPKITESQNPYIFSIMSLTPDRARFWVDFAKAMNFKRLAIIAEDTDYGTGFEKFVKDFGNDAGMEVKSIIFPRTITDMTPMLLETKAWKPDLIINLGVGPPAYLMVKQAYAIGLFPQVKMLGSFAWPVRPEYWDAVSEKGRYVLYTSYYKPGMLMSDSGKWMSAKYKAAHGEDPTFYALNVFGEMLVIAQALDKAQSDDPKLLQKALVGNTYQDWSGDVKFGEPQGLKWHNVSPPHLILQQTEVRQPFTESKLVYPSQFGGDGKIAGP